MLTGLVLSRQRESRLGRCGLPAPRAFERASSPRAAEPLLVLPRAIDRLLLEQPKPPWFVGWIELGVHAIGRRHVDLLILFSTVVPYSLLMLAGGFDRPVAARARGAAYSRWSAWLPRRFHSHSASKVMVETFLALWILLVYSADAHLRHRSVAQDRRRAGSGRRPGPTHQVDDGALPSRAIALRMCAHLSQSCASARSS